MKKSDFKKKIAEEVQSGLRGFISNAIGKAKNLPNGSIVIAKTQVDRWKKVLNSTHYKAPNTEKVWANAVADRILHVMELFKKKELKKPADPRVTEIIKEYISYCEDLRGFTPEINYSKDIVMIKRVLKKHSKEDILDCFNWFLRDKTSTELSPSISTALSSSILNKFLSQR